MDAEWVGWFFFVSLFMLVASMASKVMWNTYCSPPPRREGPEIVQGQEAEFTTEGAFHLRRSAPLNFTKVVPSELACLRQALLSNAFNGTALLTDPRHTGFVGEGSVDEDADAEVISAIRSVPTHY